MSLTLKQFDDFFSSSNTGKRIKGAYDDFVFLESVVFKTNLNEHSEYQSFGVVGSVVVLAYYRANKNNFKKIVAGQDAYNAMKNFYKWTEIF